MSMLGEPVAGASDVAFALLGDIMIDIVATLSAEWRRGTDTASNNTISGGGASANTAAWLAAAGHRTYLLGAVGHDPFGATVLQELQALGVDVKAATIPNRATGTVIAVVHPDGERTMFPDAGANLELTREAVTQYVRDLCSSLSRLHLHVSGYTLMRPQTRDMARAALELARELGATTSVDPASVGPMTDMGIEVARELFSGVDLLLANEEEAAALTGSYDPAEAAQQLTDLATAAIVKCGADGAVFADRDGRRANAAATPVDAADTLGAGDAFAAGALPAWRAGAAPEQVLARGIEFATHCVRHPGARPGGQTLALLVP